MTLDEYRILVEVRKYLANQWSSAPLYSTERDRLMKSLESVDAPINEHRLSEIRKKIHDIELTNDKSRRLEWRELKKLEKYYEGKVRSHENSK